MSSFNAARWGKLDARSKLVHLPRARAAADAALNDGDWVSLCGVLADASGSNNQALAEGSIDALAALAASREASRPGPAAALAALPAALLALLPSPAPQKPPPQHQPQHDENTAPARRTLGTASKPTTARAPAHGRPAPVLAAAAPLAPLASRAAVAPAAASAAYRTANEARTGARTDARSEARGGLGGGGGGEGGAAATAAPCATVTFLGGGKGPEALAAAALKGLKPLRCETVGEVANELRLAEAGMRADPEDWEKRVSGVQRLLRVGLGFAQQALDDAAEMGGAGGAGDGNGGSIEEQRKRAAAALDAFVEGLKGLGDLVASLCSDLRSSLMREACGAVGGLAACLGDRFSPVADLVLPSLLPLTAQAVAVIATSSDTAVRQVRGPTCFCLTDKLTNSRYVLSQAGLVLVNRNDHCL